VTVSVEEIMKSVEELDVYKLAFQLTIYIYQITENFPKSELFGLVSQMRRAAVSINSNLSEGAARGTSGDYKRFVGISCGSASINKDDFVKLFDYIDRICRMLTKLMNKIVHQLTQSTAHGPLLTDNG
jgi:hypothetical protein